MYDYEEDEDVGWGEFMFRRATMLAIMCLLYRSMTSR